MLKLAFLNLTRRKGRTLLSILGILVGVAAMVGMVSVVDGIQSEFDSVISSMQAVMVMEKSSGDQTLSSIDESYANKIARLPHVRTVMKEIWKFPSEVEGKTNAQTSLSVLQVYGIDLAASASLKSTPYSVNLAEGQLVKSGDKKGVLLGRSAADALNKFVGNSLEINGKKFTIRGIYESSSPLTEGIVVMDIGAARDLFSIESGKISSLYVEPVSSDKDAEVRDAIKFSYGDYLDVYTSGDFSSLLGSVLGNFRLLVLFVAAISALVAGIGILNTMLMSVLERRKEIGTLKAIGWTSTAILQLIVLESAAIGVLGGVLGLLLGMGAAWFVEAFFGVTTAVTPFLLAEAFLFAVFTGIVAGVYPATLASKLDPIEALRGG